MKLSKRDVNLILGIISLVIIVAFIFLVYMPKYKDYQTEMDKIQPNRTYYQQAKSLIQNLPQLEENLKSYQDKKDTKQVTKSLNENQLFITLEELADANQIDMFFQKASSQPTQTAPATGQATDPNATAGGNGTPANGTTDPNAANGQAAPATTPTTPANGQATDPNAAGGTNGTPANGTPSNGTPDPNAANGQAPTVAGANTYTMAIKGEYRSIMVFLFELRNLEFPATISQFKLVYNQNPSKDNGFPLEATFVVSFADKGGGN